MSITFVVSFTLLAFFFYILLSSYGATAEQTRLHQDGWSLGSVSHSIPGMPQLSKASLKISLYPYQSSPKSICWSRQSSRIRETWPDKRRCYLVCSWMALYENNRIWKKKAHYVKLPIKVILICEYLTRISS